jgi:hypothetical protein
MFNRIIALDNAPLTVSRPPERRLLGVCGHFVVLLVAMLPAKGIPARSRSGFVPYFNPGFFEDHVVCEYWDSTEARWMTADPQLDEIWRTRLGIGEVDLPRDWFLNAADAWTGCRSGGVDPEKFGTVGGLRGQWFIAANLIHELADLNKMERLRWDVWGAMPNLNESLSDDKLTFFDRLAVLNQSPDGSFEELRTLYERDDRVHAPERVFNAVLNETETIIARVSA